MKTEIMGETRLRRLLLVAAVCLSSCLCDAATASPTGIIAFSLDQRGYRDIYTMKPDGTDMLRLTQTDGLSEFTPRWSPDGTKIAFCRAARYGYDPDIWVMNADGSGQMNLTNTPGEWEEWPFWSPDGQKIGFSTGRQIHEIHVINLDGTGRTPLAAGNHDAHADWSPDGKWIIFDRAMTPEQGIGHGELHVMNADGTNVQRLTYTGEDDFSAAWSPDGTKIVFTSARDGYYREQVYVADFVVDADGNAQLLNQTNITTNPYRNTLPRWSPDGTHLVYDRGPAGGVERDIFVMAADGSNVVQLTNTPGVIEWGADWGIPAYGAPIPAPGAVLLGAVGVALVGCLRRRRTL